MSNIRNKFNELQTNYTVPNTIKYFEYIQTCESSDILKNIDCVFTEPDRGGIATESFILMNTFTSNELLELKNKINEFVVDASIKEYPRKDHLKVLESCMEIIDEKIESNIVINNEDLLCESVYKMNNNEIVCESVEEINNIRYIISQLLYQSIDTETKTKYFQKLISLINESQLTFEDVIFIVDSIMCMILSERHFTEYSLDKNDFKNLVSCLISKFEGTVLTTTQKNMHIRSINIVINKCRFIEDPIFKDLCDSLSNIITAIEELEEPTVNGIVYSNDLSIGKKLKTLDNMFTENAIRFITTESYCPDIYGSYFDNMMKISQGKDVVIESSSAMNVVKDIGGALHGAAKQELKQVVLLDGTKKYVSYQKMIERDISKSKTKGSLAAIDCKVSDIVQGARTFLRGKFSFGDREQDIKNTKAFLKWYSSTYKSLMTKRSNEIDEMRRESTEYYVSESVVGRNMHLVMANMFLRDTKNHDYKKIRPNLLKLVKRCKTQEDIKILRKDFYCAIGQFSVLISKTGDKKKKANMLEHVTWLKTEYMPALTERSKEINKSVKEGTEVIILEGTELDDIVFEYLNNELYTKYDPIDNQDEDDDDIDQYDDNEEEHEDCDECPEYDDESHLEILDDVDEFICEGTRLDDARKKMNVQSNKIIKAGANIGKNAEKAKQVAGAATRGVTTIGKNIDDKLSDVVNNVKKVYRNDLRNDIIEDKTRVKLMRLIRNGIVAGTTIALGQGIGAIAVLSAFALKKNAKEKERRKILNELELELKVVEEKLEDSKSDGDREKKYKLMRIKNQLEKDINRIKYRLSSDNQGV